MDAERDEVRQFHVSFSWCSQFQSSLLQDNFVFAEKQTEYASVKKQPNETTMKCSGYHVKHVHSFGLKKSEGSVERTLVETFFFSQKER